MIRKSVLVKKTCRKFIAVCTDDTMCMPATSSNVYPPMIVVSHRLTLSFPLHLLCASIYKRNIHILMFMQTFFVVLWHPTNAPTVVVRISETLCISLIFFVDNIERNTENVVK